MKEISLVELFRAIWTTRKTLLKWTIVGFVGGVVIAFSIPKEYSSYMELVPEGNSKGSAASSMGALAGMIGISGGASIDGVTEELYPKIAQSAPFLMEFTDIEVVSNGRKITLYDYLTKNQKQPWWSYVLGFPSTAIGWIVGSDEKESPAVEYDAKKPTCAQFAFEGALSKRISIASDKKSGVITLEVLMQNPEIAAQIADSVYSKLYRYVIEYRTEKARYDLASSEKLFKEAKQKYYEADAAYAGAVDRNQNLIMRTAQMRIDRLGDERSLAFSVYQQLANQVEANRMKLQEQTPIATILQPARIYARPESPNKLLYIIACSFLAAFIWIVKVTVKNIIAQTK